MENQTQEVSTSRADTRPSSLYDLKQRPAWDLVDWSIMLGLPLSTLQQILQEHPAPTFKLGRRVFILQADASDWLNDMSIKTAMHTVTRRRRKVRVEVE
jgi:hypothetical protein